MAYHPHPIDEGLFKLTSCHRGLIRLFMRNGELCVAEQQVLQLLDEGRDEIAAYRARQRFTDSYERGGVVTRRTRELARDAGLFIVGTGEERGRIVAFPTQDDDAG